MAGGLKGYRDKRDFRSTGEPRGGKGSRGARGQFVIQQHRSRGQGGRVHFDFRLEVEGALASWAVPKGPSTDPAEKRLALRVEDHPSPVQELRRLVKVHRGYQHMNAGDLAVEEGDLERAELEYGKAEEILEGNLEARYWHAVALVSAGEVDAALPIFAEVFAQGENWRTLTPRLAAVGFLPDDPSVLERILATGR